VTEYEKFAQEKLKAMLLAEGYMMVREVPGRGVCGLYKFLFTIGLVYGCDATGYAGRWCYPSMGTALESFFKWDGVGDPPGPWIKYKGRGGEYSNPAGKYDQFETYPDPPKENNQTA
jgi:hypothetical protein